MKTRVLRRIAERAFLRRLDGSCRTPIAAHFRLTEDGAEMAGEVLADDGRQALARRRHDRRPARARSTPKCWAMRWPRMSPPSAPMTLAKAIDDRRRWPDEDR